MKKHGQIGILLFMVAAVVCTAETRGAAARLTAEAAELTSAPTAEFQRRPKDYPSLRDTRDADMHRALVTQVAKLQLTQAVQQNKLGIALVDITDPGHPRMADINGDVMFYAASLPKIAILFGAFQRAAEGTLPLDDIAVSQLTRMIRYSSNADATVMLNRVGKVYLAELLQSDRYKLYDPSYGGGLWVGKEYAKAGAWKRDPINNFSHGATAYEVARFYYLLETDRLVSAESCKRMKEILSKPAINHKFVRGLHQHRPGSSIYRKSGSWKYFHSDSAIVERDGRRYIAVAWAVDPNGDEWLSRLIVALDDIIFAKANIMTSTQPT